MEVVLKIDDLLAREKEIFAQYVATAKEIDLLPLLDKYGKIDNQVYSIEQAYSYIKLYVTSKIISKEELLTFQNIQKVDSTIIFKRGKKVLQTLIKSNGDEKELFFLGSEFAKLDGKINSYPISYVKRCLAYYCKNTKNKTLINVYNIVLNLTRDTKGKSFDLSLIYELIKFNNIISAVNFLKNINISNSTLQELIYMYRVLYPANSNEITYLNEVINTLKRQEICFILPQHENNKTKNIKKLQRLLECYLVSDVSDIELITNQYHMSKYEFREILKDALMSDDPILLSLIDKYHLKEQSIKAINDEIVIKIGNSIINGVNYGNGFRKFNVYDYLTMYENLDIELIINSIDEHFEGLEVDYIKEVLEHLELNDTYQSLDSLKDSIGVFSKNGRNITEEEKTSVITFMEESHFPLNNSVFFAICERYFDEDIILVKKKISA